ncbi:MAG: DUF4166 domain-containing protein [Robiginitomaculum sp.]|nr:DUF4166 domain-containing protein [Robiginitomaculum sp.]
MRKVLIIGGYGQFGGRLCQRLSDIANIKVLVAGRNLSKAEALCKQHGGNLSPQAFDLEADIETQLKALEPWLVIDAAGPFQSVFGHSYALPETCMRRGIHYIDLSDSGEFTKGIAALDTEAKRHGVAVISGASSVPALSSAVVDAAKPRFARITSIEGGISPGGKIDIGLSVTRAVLSYLGKPLKIFVGGTWMHEFGYARVHKHKIALIGEPALNRYFGLCDAPDLLLFPQHYKGVDTVRFYGSQELWLIHISICILAWLQKRKIVRNLQNHARFFSRVGTWLGRFASERGGMYMHILGIDSAGSPISQQWNLIASEGDGPFIPTLAAEILTRRWLEQDPRPGARPALSQISLGEFEQAFSSLAIKSEFEDMKPAPYLYQQVLGENFDELPDALRAGHAVSNTKIMSGRVDVVRGKNPLSYLAATCIGFAKTGTDQPITIIMDVKNQKEVWTRTIDGQSFRSVLSKDKRPHEIYERFGPVKFKMLFRIENEKLYYDIVSAKLLGLPFPKFLLPKSVSHERVQGGRFFFDVEIKLPVLGRLISYKGWLV